MHKIIFIDGMVKMKYWMKLEGCIFFNNMTGRLPCKGAGFLYSGLIWAKRGSRRMDRYFTVSSKAPGRAIFPMITRNFLGNSVFAVFQAILILFLLFVLSTTTLISFTVFLRVH